MLTVRGLGVGGGFDHSGSGGDVAALLGLRTMGKSFLSGSVGLAKANFSPLCAGFCPASRGDGVTFELGAQASAPWASLGLMYVETRAEESTSWHGILLTVGVGKFR